VSDSDREDYHNLVDIVFVLDSTGSMSWCFEECKTTINRIMTQFSKKEFNIKFGLVQYRDHPPQEETFVTKHF